MSDPATLTGPLLEEAVFIRSPKCSLNKVAVFTDKTWLESDEAFPRETSEEELWWHLQEVLKGLLFDSPCPLASSR